MNPFIHTFSVIVNITGEELSILVKRYRWIDLKKSYKGKYYDSSIIEFCDKGLQMQIRRRTEKEIKSDNKHNPFQIELVVTPYKLLYPCKNMGAITTLEEMGKAIIALGKLLEQIKMDTGINLISDAKNVQRYKIKRVDLTCDVETPSDDYSKEIIAVSKVVKLPYGYTRCDVSEEDIEMYGWKRENACSFYNKNQDVYIKIYNKKENLKGKEEYRNYLDKGLLRYEISMPRGNLKKQGILLKDKLGECLRKIMDSGKSLFDKYIIQNLPDLSMVSFPILEKLLKKYMSGKEKTLEKMLHLCKIAYKCKKAETVFSAEQCGMSEVQFKNCYRKFSELGVSPIPVEKGLPYIPATESMLNGKIERKFAYFASKKSRGKEIWGL